MTEERPICPGCGLPHAELRKSPWISVPVCEHCLFVWYDGASEVGGAELVRKESRARQGIFL